MSNLRVSRSLHTHTEKHTEKTHRKTQTENTENTHTQKTHTENKHRKHTEKHRENTHRKHTEKTRAKPHTEKTHIETHAQKHTHFDTNFGTFSAHVMIVIVPSYLSWHQQLETKTQEANHESNCQSCSKSARQSSKHINVCQIISPM